MCACVCLHNLHNHVYLSRSKPDHACRAAVPTYKVRTPTLFGAYTCWYHITLTYCVHKLYIICDNGMCDISKCDLVNKFRVKQLAVVLTLAHYSFFFITRSNLVNSLYLVQTWSGTYQVNGLIGFRCSSHMKSTDSE